MKVAIQGIKGSFHHLVAEQYFGKNIDIVECLSFNKLPNLLHKKEAEVAVMAIENSIAGAILPNYALIDEHNLTISGEYYLSVHHNLMVLGNQKIEDITEVYSHPMALLQCREFFRKYPEIKLIEDTDTASVAKRIRKQKLKGVAAIASKAAAEIYQLTILADGIQTIKENTTRFFVLTKSENKHNVSANKASIKFIVSDDTGSLAEVLTILAKHHLNLSKIQSLPVIETPWKYAFFADFVFNSYADYFNALSAIKHKVEMLQVLGEYTKSKR